MRLIEYLKENSSADLELLEEVGKLFTEYDDKPEVQKEIIEKMEKMIGRYDKFLWQGDTSLAKGTRLLRKTYLEIRFYLNTSFHNIPYEEIYENLYDITTYIITVRDADVVFKTGDEVRVQGDFYSKDLGEHLSLDTVGVLNRDLLDTDKEAYLSFNEGSYLDLHVPVDLIYSSKV